MSDKSETKRILLPSIDAWFDSHPMPALGRRDAEIKDVDGNVVFSQSRIEAPGDWSDLAVKIVASKYFWGKLGTPEREMSVYQLVARVVGNITGWGLHDGVIALGEPEFCDNLYRILLNQIAAFNSPVWFNCGVDKYAKGGAGNYRWDEASQTVVACEDTYLYPQVSACFIQSVADDMGSIMELARSEAMLFKYGSGTGTDLTPLRSSRDSVTGGGKASGPVSFMRIYDAIGGAIKSGGKTRRAAKMQTLAVWHPDINQFIMCKAMEEEKAQALIAAGYGSGLDDEAYSTVAFQNSNLSVRADDEFMKLATETDEGDYELKFRDPENRGLITASDTLDDIAYATAKCGDPGMQFIDTINRWHTCKASGTINSSNPCSEYIFLDDSACNLASIRLTKFLKDDDTFDTETFVTVVRYLIIAQDILVDNASYPTAKIAQNSHDFRPLGLGYADLGALIMSLGIPYDSQPARDLAAAITALMHFTALDQSQELAEVKGPFAGWEMNKESFGDVVMMYMAAFSNLRDRFYQTDILANTDHVDRMTSAILGATDQIVGRIKPYGHFRNAQVTLLAPTGTIGFMMDCDTTGIEPSIGLVQHKSLAGGGSLKIVNQTVKKALKRLAYGDSQAILSAIEDAGSVLGIVDDEDYAIFDCALPEPLNGRCISWRGHVEMMAAVQPFLSGAISKTVNLPADATVETIREVYVTAWKLGLKAIAIYRDGSKGSQPVTTSKPVIELPPEPMVGRVTEIGSIGTAEADPAKYRLFVFEDPGQAITPTRRRMPTTRQSLTHKFDINGHEGYFTVGFYPDGNLGELFIRMAKEGSTIGGLTDALATSVSIGLQYGVPLEVFVNKFSHTRFEPAGFTKSDDDTIKIASSITDYIFRWLRNRFIGHPEQITFPHMTVADLTAGGPEPAPAASPTISQGDGNTCPVCGGLTVRTGSCRACTNCGESLGCS
jgi:ribonucleoside-diphosphate reductase alpha chain